MLKVILRGVIKTAICKESVIVLGNILKIISQSRSVYTQFVLALIGVFVTPLCGTAAELMETTGTVIAFYIPYFVPGTLNNSGNCPKIVVFFLNKVGLHFIAVSGTVISKPRYLGGIAVGKPVIILIQHGMPAFSCRHGYRQERQKHNRRKDCGQ